MKRKRTLSTALVILGLVIMLPSCNAKREVSTVLQRVSPLSANGTGSMFARDIEADTELPATLPVYEEKYPVGHGGPQYEFDDEAREELEAEMNSLLDLMYQEAGFPVPEDGFLLSAPEEGKEFAYNNRRTFETDDFFVFGWPNLLRIKIPLELSDPLVLSITEGNLDLLLDNFATRAALEYVGVEVENMELRQLEGSSSQYQMIEASDSMEELIYRTAFRYVQIDLICMEDRASLFIDACRKDPEKLEEVDTFSQEEVFAFVQENYPDFDLTSATCRLYFDEMVDLGKFRPCYQVRNWKEDTIHVSPMLVEELASSATDYDLESSES